jgi:hypothetical protein
LRGRRAEPRRTQQPGGEKARGTAKLGARRAGGRTALAGPPDPLPGPEQPGPSTLPPDSASRAHDMVRFS